MEAFHLQRYMVTLLTLLTIVTSCLGDVSDYAPKPGDFKRLDTPTNKTLDQLITEALGGIDVASNKILAPGSYVLAELDMYLSQEQFLTLYEPPSNKLMISSSEDAPSHLSRKERGAADHDVIAPGRHHDITNDAVLQTRDQKTSGTDKTAKFPSTDDVIPAARHKRKAMRDVILRWPNAEIPYHLALGDFSDKEEYLIKQAMSEWERYTCLKFRPAANNDVNLVRFQNGEGCISQLGMVGGVQVLTLDKEGCRFKGLYLHEIGHAIGLVHEHQLPDRDDYIEILMQNVAPHFRVFFSKYSPIVINQFSVPYEYSSIMHYGITAFSHDGQSQTIKAKDPSKEDSIGKVFLKELSFSDVKVVNQMYGCADSCPALVRCTGDGFLDQNCRCVCPDGSDSCEVSTIKTTSNRPTNPDEDDKNKSDGNAGVKCENLYEDWKCSVWANQGECDRNPRYMKKNCKKSCGLCNTKKPTKEEETKNHFTTWAWQWFGMFTNLFPKDWMIGICKDVFSFEKCNKWKVQGDCVTNALWMETNCKMTCNFCGNPAFRPEVNCRNHHDDKKCDQWAQEGECVLNARWMRDSCQRACRACADTLDTDTDKGSRKDDEDECVDKHDTKECKLWTKAGECYVNPTWMTANCRKSCDKCNDGSCKDLYDETQCAVWAQEKECSMNRVWMSNNCMKSCGLCEYNYTEPPDETTTVSGSDVTGSTENDKTGSEGSGKTGSGSGKTGKDDSGKNGNDDSGKTGSGKEGTGSRFTTRRRDVDTDDVDHHTVSTRTTTTDRPDTESCYNAHNNVECDIWAATSHCEINPTWMHVHCRKSCKQCDVDTAGTGKQDTCVDEHGGCEGWSKTGFCETNPGYNLIHCKKSCDNCNGCRDEQFTCAMWTKAGHCRTNAGFMLRQCQKSCNTCKRN